MTLENESLSKLRGIAQSLGVRDVFAKTKLELVQSISLKQEEATPKLEVVIDKPQYDARLMTKPPARISDEAIVREYLQPYIDIGMKLRIEDGHWYIAHGIKTDEGSLHMPPRVILNCAKALMK